MAVAFDPTDPSSLTPEQRHEELCALLARGVVRLLAVRAAGVAADVPPLRLSSPESDKILLDESPEVMAHDTRLVNATRDETRSYR